MKKFILLIAVFLASLSSYSQFVEPTSKADVYQSVNEYRANHGLQPLQISEKLERSSEFYAMRVNIFQKKERHDKAWLNRHKDSGELLGVTYRPVDGWKESYTHSKMLRSKRYAYMGLGRSGDTYVLRLI